MSRMVQAMVSSMSTAAARLIFGVVDAAVAVRAIRPDDTSAGVGEGLALGAGTAARAVVANRLAVAAAAARINRLETMRGNPSGVMAMVARRCDDLDNCPTLASRHGARVEIALRNLWAKLKRPPARRKSPGRYALRWRPRRWPARNRRSCPWTGAAGRNRRHGPGRAVGATAGSRREPPADRPSAPPWSSGRARARYPGFRAVAGMPATGPAPGRAWPLRARS